MNAEYDLPPGWVKPSADVAQKLERELQRELVHGHALHGFELEIVAQRQDCDDVLVRDRAGELSIVHLTWTSKPERPPFPTVTEIGNFSSFAAWNSRHYDSR